MNVPTLEELTASLEARVTDPAKAELVASIAADATRITGYALVSPEKMATEVLHLQAQVANLTSAEASAVADIFTDWAARLVFAVVSTALAP